MYWLSFIDKVSALVTDVAELLIYELEPFCYFDFSNVQL